MIIDIQICDFVTVIYDRKTFKYATLEGNCMKDYLNRLKSEKSMTNQQIANLSGVSLSTVNRIMAGSAKNPSHEAVVSICSALGGDPAGIESEHETHPDCRCEIFVRVLEGYEQQFDREREAYDAQLRTKDRWIRALAVALGVIIAIILALLVVDMLTPHIGWLKG